MGKQKLKKRKDPNDKSKQPICESCEQIMTLQGGYAETGLCGVCATGEAAILEEFGDTW